MSGPGSKALATRCGPLRMANPVLAASGTFGYGDAFTDFFPLDALGGFVTKTLFLSPRDGNPPPRIAETSCGMLNSIGLANIGWDAFVDEKAALVRAARGSARTIVNIAGNAPDEYAALAARVERDRGAVGCDVIEVNVSCPNVKEGGVQFGNSPEMSGRVVAACRKVTKKPLITKLSPNQTDIALNARVCIEAGTDGLAVINTLTGMAIDTRTGKPIIGNRQGGLSGPAIKPIALLKTAQVSEVARPHRIPIIGQGGIVNAGDALEFLMAGATAIGVGTALFYDPLVCPKINRGLAEHLEARGLASISALAA